MTNLQFVRNIMEIAGTVAFATAGAMTAIDRELDLFGVVIIGCITATGGGIIRDTLTDYFPAVIFSSWITLLIAFSVSLMTFIFAYLLRERWHAFAERIDRINNYVDAVGLAAFTVTGTEMAIDRGFGNNWVFTIVLGVITGVGGGVLRDVLTHSTPYIFLKHIYAIASILGSFVYLISYSSGLDENLCVLLAFAVVLIIRILATKYHWELPRIPAR